MCKIITTTNERSKTQNKCQFILQFKKKRYFFDCIGIIFFVMHTLVNLNEQKKLKYKRNENLFVAIIRFTSLEIGKLNWF